MLFRSFQSHEVDEERNHAKHHRGKPVLDITFVPEQYCESDTERNTEALNPRRVLQPARLWIRTRYDRSISEQYRCRYDWSDDGKQT